MKQKVDERESENIEIKSDNGKRYKVNERGSKR